MHLKTLKPIRMSPGKTSLKRRHLARDGQWSNQRGLSTIEVIAALLLFSVALLPIVQVQLNAQRGAVIVSEIEATTQLERQALNFLESVNFAQQPEGQFSFGDGQIRWQAVPIREDAELIRNLDRISLFRVQVEMLVGDRVVSTRVLHAVGWRPAFAQ